MSSRTAPRLPGARSCCSSRFAHMSSCRPFAVICPGRSRKQPGRIDASLTSAPAPAIFSAMPSRSRVAGTPQHAKPSLQFSLINAILLLAGFAAIVLGYHLLSRGSTAAAPLLLVLGYAVLIPLGIIL